MIILQKNDDASLTKNLEGKSKFATNTTCNVFELLEKAGIPTAYIWRIENGPESFVAKKVKMIPLEVVCRRYATWSYLKRMPHLIKNDGTLHRFEYLKFELFLKTSNGSLVVDGNEVIKWLQVDDPLIENLYDEKWNIVHPKQMNYEKSEVLEIIDSKKVLWNISVKDIVETTRKTFLVLEAAWAINYWFKLIDFKIEFGIDQEWNLVVADVIDNDSWRLYTNENKDVSKENFRQNMSLDKVRQWYELVSLLSNNLSNIPNQVIILWRGSASDDIPQIPDIKGLSVEDIVISWHKKPAQVLKKLNELEWKYPQWAVIINFVGMSNGLWPTLSAQTQWPVINCLQGLDKYPEDLFSNVRLPSNTPASTIINPKNAVLHALNILSLTNPIIAMHRRYQVEEVVNS